MARVPLQVSELSPRPPLTRRPLDAFQHRPHHASRITHRVPRQLFSFFNAGDMDGVRRMVAGHFSDDCLLRTVVMDKVSPAGLPAVECYSLGCFDGRLFSLC